MSDSIPPGSWLGLLGGGQLGRMFCMAAQSLGYKVAVLDPGAASPAGTVADRHISAEYLHPPALAELSALVAAATTEFENVPVAALEFLSRTARVTPAAASVAIAQDRISEKMFLSGHGFPLTPFLVLRTRADARNAPSIFFPGVVKTARFGYDGKGQIACEQPVDADAAVEALGAPCVLERWVPLSIEISVIVARNERGETAFWPVAENRHRDHILDVSIAPARLPPELSAHACALATRIATALDYRGVLCVEMFVGEDDALLVNEIAPRPHNSGHYTIDACVTSQFEQQVRVLADLPLGDTRQHTPAVMVNLLGDIWFAGPEARTAREPPWRDVLSQPQAKLHLYGKAEPRRKRKMGHVTCLGATLDEALATAREVKRALGICGAEDL